MDSTLLINNRSSIPDIDVLIMVAGIVDTVKKCSGITRFTFDKKAIVIEAERSGGKTQFFVKDKEEL